MVIFASLIIHDWRHCVRDRIGKTLPVLSLTTILVMELFSRPFIHLTCSSSAPLRRAVVSLAQQEARLRRLDRREPQRSLRLFRAFAPV